MWNRARKVIGVEFSDFAIVARKVVGDNNLVDIVTIVHWKVENIQLPDVVEKVDVIVSVRVDGLLFVLLKYVGLRSIRQGQVAGGGWCHVACRIKLVFISSTIMI